ncbi:putative P450 monooxygenase [Teratosphaeria nubilosa]|uniref:Putative P450 monooxygenase n=1 Tax=Teratosphaeria nubilosa TaxID=161662 RepID=A0A6G1LLP0_9PEZI|nr:putative P450 monooxygenase [Teratosphaeria nubilosa]
MHASFLLAVWAVAAFLIFKAISKLYEDHRHKVRANELGCKDVPSDPNQGFLGLKGIRELQAADKEQLFPDRMIERQERMSLQTPGRICATFKTSMFGKEVFATSDPENIKAILATQFNDFELGRTRRGNFLATLGDGIFVQDGQAWAHSRALLRPNFVRDQISDLDLEEKHIQNLFRVLKPGEDGWTAETNLQVLFFRLTIDSATEFLFGESVDSQIHEAEGSSSSKQNLNERLFAKNFDSANLHMAKRSRYADMYWLHNPKEYKENNKIINDFVKHYVDLALSKTSSQKKAEEGHEKYVFLEALAEQTRDPEELRAQLLNILLAGRDTTASLLSWLFLELLRNPEVFAKLRQTVNEDFGTYSRPKEITFATLKGSQYLSFCLSEALRLWPVVPINGRRSNKATTLPRGGGADGQSPVYIKPDTDVNYSVHVMQRRKDLWGPDADQFVPERFLGKKPGWEYLPFNGGPRICIGQQFALTEASYVVVRLLQRFDQIRPGADGLERVVRSNLSLTNAPAKPVTLRLHEAQD